MGWGHLSNMEGVLRCSVCNRDEGGKSTSPCCSTNPHRAGEVGASAAKHILGAFKFLRNSEGRS